MVEKHSEEHQGEPEKSESPPRAEKAEETSQADEIARLEAELVTKQQEAKEFHEQLMRKAAELENYKKRAQKEKEELTRLAQEGFIYALLPVLDNFERALEAAQGSQDKAALLRGVELIYQQFFGVLTKMGLEEVPCQGQPFDPNFHHAIAHIEVEGHSENMVVETCQKGYKLKGRLLRPAMVSVAKQTSAGAEEEAPDVGLSCDNG